jgi:hypothetical protein
VNYYYLLRFEVQTRRLLSVHKRYIRDKVLPINVKAMIKNRGIFNRGNLLDQRDQAEDKERKIREGITGNSHYFAHRVLYAFKNGELMSKVKNFYALELFETCKQDYLHFGQLVGEVRVVNEAEPVSIRKVENNNHHLMVEVRDRLYLYSIYMEVGKEEVEEVPLLNESIISIDTRKFAVYALVSHPVYVLPARCRPTTRPSSPATPWSSPTPSSSSSSNTSPSSSSHSTSSNTSSTCTASSSAAKTKWQCFRAWPSREISTLKPSSRFEPRARESSRRKSLCRRPWEWISTQSIPSSTRRIIWLRP